MAMDHELLRTHFDRIGAHLQITAVVSPRQPAGIDIVQDRRGAYYALRVNPAEAVDYQVIDVRPNMRHLLLLGRRGPQKEKYLCGYDERHWFVCAVPARPGVSGVVTAMAALQPAEVQRLAERTVRPQDRLRRRTAAFVRQGEWFFIPTPALVVDPRLIHQREPIRRGNGGTAHMCQFLYRQGGELVMVCHRRPQGITMDAYQLLINTQPQATHWGWTRMRRNAEVYVRGRVNHPDHKTVVLDPWHRVLMNTEQEAPNARHVVFLD